MSDVTEQAGSDLATLEEQFLAELEQRPLPLEAMLATLRHLRAQGKGGSAESWSGMLQEALVASEDHLGMLRLLKLLLEWRGDSRNFATQAVRLLQQCNNHGLWSAYLASVGFGEATTEEALRRLELLLKLQPGCNCLDKAWGFGVVKSLDDFYKRMVVDFTIKPNHALSFANAAASLALVGDDHPLALRHNDAASFEQMLREKPAEVVRMMLQAFGPLSQARLETLFDELKIVASANWKGFWDRARKELKSDPLVELPSKRSEPLRLRERAMAYDCAWFAALRAQRDTEAIMRLIGELEEAEPQVELDGEARTALSDRLAFALKGAFRSDAARYARLALMTRRLALEQPEAGEMRAHLWDAERYLQAAEGITARECAQLVTLLLEESGAVVRLTATLPRMCFNLLGAALEQALDGAEAATIIAGVRELLLETTVPPALLVWVLRNYSATEGWELPSRYILLMHALAIIEDRNLSGELLRMQHQLRALFENAKWLEAHFGALEAVQQEAIFDRIYGTTLLWDPATQRMLIGRMVGMAPALAKRKQSGETQNTQPAERWTSWRSLRERHDDFKRLIEQDIPRNSQEIATARSYGDLRENFEYQAAKQQQAVLLGRRDQWDFDLKQMRGTDFSQADCSVVGMGVAVCFERANGERQRISILGEWDRDEALGIIANRSRLAESLVGHKVGEEVAIPALNGEEVVTIRAIEALSEAVRQWIGATVNGKSA